MKLFISFVAMISLMVIGNLLLKTGAVMGAVALNPWVNLLNWRIVAGLFSFGLAVLIYILVLRQLPISVAQSFLAAQFIAVILASSFVLSEPIGVVQWVGIAFIACGIAIVGWSHG